MIDSRLSMQLERAAARLGRLRLWRRLTLAWLLAALCGAVLWIMSRSAGWELDHPRAIVAGVALAAAAVGAWLARVAVRDPRWVARQVEAAYPDLNSCLLAAIELRPELPGKRFGFLQDCVIGAAIRHARLHTWENVVGRRRYAAAVSANLAALSLLACVLTGLAWYPDARGAAGGGASTAAPPQAKGSFSVTVEPGNTEVERGTSLLVLARFTGPQPADATLVYQDAGGEATRLAMSKSLDDPVFGGRVGAVDEPLDYHVELAGETTDTYHVTVFEYPRLVRADASLVFPSYTALDERLIEDVRTVSVVEGTEVTLICRLNKRVASATLVEQGAEPIALAPADQRQQLDDTRDQVRRASESLEEERVSRAAAAGTRAQRDFEDLRNEFRRRASGRFGEELREMRDAARQLDEDEERLAERLSPQPSSERKTESVPFSGRQAEFPSLGTEADREKLPVELRRQRERLDELLERMRQTIQEAEPTEPLLSQRLYDAARQAEEQAPARALSAAEQSLRRGLLDDARQQEDVARRGIGELREGVERAAESVLGDGTDALRRAREELDRLARELAGEVARNAPREPGASADEAPQQRPSSAGERSVEPAAPRNVRQDADRTIAPIAGDDFLDWSDRLRDVEEMVDDPQWQAEAARIRDQARGFRVDLKRHARAPNWGLVREEVLAPLAELRDRVAEELLRRTSREAVVPLDRDPVPPKYSEKTRRYYERLGIGK